MEKSKVIFGNVQSGAVYKKAVKSKAKYAKKFGDDSDRDYSARVVDNEYIGDMLGVKNIIVGDAADGTSEGFDREKGIITIVYQTVGAETERMSRMNEGECFADVVGPLGNPSDLCDLSIEELKAKKILFIAGGVGTAPVYNQLKWLHDNGIEVDCIQGARTKELLIFEDEMKAVTKNLYFATDDGSYGIHGNVCVALQQLWDEGIRYDHCVVIGPVIMMKFACQLTKKLGIHTIVSMNTIMVDGTGMCGACRLLVGGEVKFACVDGPEFDGHEVDFDQALQRSRLYKTQEGELMLRLTEGDTHSGGCGMCS